MTEDPDREAARRFAKEMTRKLADEGRVIEGGWQSLKALAIPPDAPKAQLDEMRVAFFAGAHHLFFSIMASFDAGEEPTAADERRLDLIRSELEAYGQELERRVER